MAGLGKEVLKQTVAILVAGKMNDSALIRLPYLYECLRIAWWKKWASNARLMHVGLRLNICRHKTLIQCCFNVGPSSWTLDQRKAIVNSTSSGKCLNAVGLYI